MKNSCKTYSSSVTINLAFVCSWETQLQVIRIIRECPWERTVVSSYQPSLASRAAAGWAHQSVESVSAMDAPIPFQQLRMPSSVLCAKYGCAGVPVSRYSTIASSFVCPACSLTASASIVSELKSEIVPSRLKFLSWKPLECSLPKTGALCSISSLSSEARYTCQNG